MLKHITIILLCQLFGEITAKLANIQIPGPVIGMVILFCILCLIGNTPKELEKVTNFLLGFLPLFFVPAGVGVIKSLDILSKSWVPVTLSVLLGTAITIAVTGFLMQILNRR